MESEIEKSWLQELTLQKARALALNFDRLDEVGEIISEFKTQSKNEKEFDTPPELGKELNEF